MKIARREALLLAAAGVGAAAIGGVVGALVRQSGSGAAALLAARYPDLDGQVRRLRDYRGRVVICNFWATWCAPCREEVPLLVAAKRQWANKSVEIVGIGIDSADKIREFAKTYQINYPLLIANGSALELIRKLGNRAGALPFTVVLDRTGSLVDQHLGALTAADLRRLAESLFG